MTQLDNAVGDRRGDGGDEPAACPDLLDAWRGPDGAGYPAAVTGRLAELAAGGGPVAVEQIVVSLTALANMFIELYADCTGSPVRRLLREVAELTVEDGP